MKLHCEACWPHKVAGDRNRRSQNYFDGTSNARESYTESLSRLALPINNLDAQIN